MHTLRNSSLLARLILAWFVLTIGAAVASPIVHPQAIELVCSANGSMKMVVMDDDEVAALAHHTLDCPICLSLTLPVELSEVQSDLSAPMAHALHKFSVAHIASLVGAPLPARGPPAAL